MSSQGDEEICCICQSEYGASNQERFTLSCGHHIHASCMLRYCLRTSDERCPICRQAPQRSLRRTQPSGGVIEIPDTESEDETSYEESSSFDDEPQWLSIPCTARDAAETRLQKAIVRKLLRRAKSNRAPKTLKLCLEKHLSLRNDVVGQREALKRLKSRRVKSVEEALGLHQLLAQRVMKASRTYETHFREVLRRCQASKTVRDYFTIHPLTEVFV